MHYDNQNREVPDKTPVELPLGYNAPEPLELMIARLIRASTIHAVRNGMESFEEADDFEVEDAEGETVLSNYEVKEMDEEHFRPKNENPERAAEPQESIKTPEAVAK